jgi:hypothetical protein
MPGVEVTLKVRENSSEKKAVPVMACYGRVIQNMILTRHRHSVDVLYPTSILRPVYCYTVLSSARSGVRGTQRPKRPANIVYCTAPR